MYKYKHFYASHCLPVTKTKKMQSLLRKLITHHRHHHHHRPNLSYTFHRNIFRNHSAFSSLPKPPSRQQLGHRITPSFFIPTHPLHHSHSHSHSCCSLPTQIRRFLSDPMVASNCRNALARVSTSRRLLDFRPKLPTAHFHRHSFGFNQSPDLYRGW